MNAIFVLLVINAGTIVYSTIVEYFRSSVPRKCYVLLCTYSYNKLFCDARALKKILGYPKIKIKERLKMHT